MNERTPPTTDTTGTNQDHAQQQPDRNAHRGQRNRNFDTSFKFFKGSTAEIGATLSLSNERVSTDKGFEFFQDQLETYILRELKNPTDIVILVTDLVDPTSNFLNNMPTPAFDATEAAADPMKKAVNDQMAKQFAQRIDALRTNIAKVYGLVWGQCTTGLQAEIKSEDDYNSKASAYDTLWLLETVKKKSSGVATRGNKYLNMLNVLTHFFRDTTQGRNESEDAWYRRFKAECDTVEVADLGYLFYNQVASGHNGVNVNPSANEIAAEIEACKAMFFLQFSNMQRYPDLMPFLRNSEMVNNDQYPKTLVGVYELLLQYRNDSNYSRRGNRNGNPNGNSRVSFLQNRNMSEPDKDNPVAGRDGNIVDRQCYKCHAYGHISSQCPQTNVNSNVQALQFGISLTQTHDSSNSFIDPSWILLDTCSTDSVFANLSMVTNHRNCRNDEILRIHTNGGTQTFHQLGDLKFLPLKVHVNEKSMANILSLKDVAALDEVRVTMDSKKERSIAVHLSSGLTYVFREGEGGLYYFDTGDPDNHIKYTSAHYSFLSTVANNKLSFTKAQIKGADAARALQSVLAWPSIKDFKHLVASNAIKNSPVTIDDIDRAEHIYGPALPTLQGKMTRSSPKTKPTVFVPVPLDIFEHHKFIDLYADFLFVNGIPFMHTKSANINFLSIQHCTSRSATTIKNSLKFIKDKYESRGFVVAHLHADNEFNVNGLDEVLCPTQMHIYAANEHVGVIERSIRTIKERCRCISHSMPYTMHPKILTRCMLEFVVTRLNQLPSSTGVSKVISPATIVLGKGPLDCQYNTIDFGSYVVLYTTTTNDMKRRSVPCIALNPTNNFGGYNFMSLESGRKLHGYKWKELPMDDWVIARVEEIAKKEGQPKLVNKTPIFEWTPGVPTDLNDGVDEEQIDSDNNSIADNEDESEVMVFNNEDVVQVTEDDDLSEEDSDIDSIEEDSLDDKSDVFETDKSNEDPADDLNHDQGDIPIEAHEENENDVQATEDVAEGEEATSTLRRSTRSNRGAGVERLRMDFRGKSYSKEKAVQFLQQSSPSVNGDNEVVSKDAMRIATGVVFTQMSAKKGFKIVGEAAVAAMFKELKQLDEGPMPGKPVVQPVDVDTLSQKVKEQAMEAVNLIKIKRCGKIKGRTCANGSKQRKYLSPEDSVASPTVSLEAFLTTLLIDAQEGRDVAIFDVPGAYLHAKFPDDKTVLMRLRDEFVDIMCEVNPEYKKYVKVIGGKKLLYLRVLRAIYGCIESALLWYNLFSSILVQMGFTLNPYDKCVANKMVNGKQMTIVWYVDDCKVSHVNPGEVTNLVNELKEYLGDLKTSRGKTHTFLGINFKIKKDKNVELEMIDQLNEAVTAFGEVINKTAATASKPYLFNVREDAELLDKEKSEVFHSVVAKLLYIMKRTRPDLEPTVAFLSTRVSCSTVDDWNKLKRLLQFIKGTINDKRIIGANGLNDLLTWVDAAYAVHPNMRSHTGGCMSFGLGTLHARSTKQKLNTKSSTEAEIVGMSDYLPFNIWLRMFLEEQGYFLTNNIVYQDNQSAIRMERNGRNSCTGNSRHVDIRYFFVKDRIDKDEISVEYCPTDIMLADFLTKPLQGRKFHLFRAVIMGYKPLSALFSSSDPKERV